MVVFCTMKGFKSKFSEDRAEDWTRDGGSNGAEN